MNSYIELEPGYSLTFANDTLSALDYHRDKFLHPSYCPPISASTAHEIISSSPKKAIFQYQKRIGEIAMNKIMPDALRLGLVSHSVLLRERDWEKNIKLIRGDFRKKENRTIGLQAQADGLVPIKENEWEVLREMNTAFEENEIAQRLLVGGDSELSIFWKDNDYPRIINKARIDFVPTYEGLKNNQWAIDYKTCRSLVGWGKTYLWNYGLAVKFAHYVDAIRAMHSDIKRVGIAYFTQEKEFPYDLAAHLVVASGDEKDEIGGKRFPSGYKGSINVGNTLYALGKKQLNWVKEEWTKCLDAGEYPARMEIGYLDVGKISDQWDPPTLSQKIKVKYRR